MLIAADVKPKDAKSIVKAYKRITDTPFGTNLKFGFTTDEDMVRSKWIVNDNIIMLLIGYKKRRKIL